MKPIPIRAAEEIAKLYGYDQIVVIGRAVGDGGGEHVTTYGRDAIHCKVAASCGRALQAFMGWPSEEDERSAAILREVVRRFPHGGNQLGAAISLALALAAERQPA